MVHTIIWDETGRIYFDQAGDINKPIGVKNMLEVEVPDGQFAERIDLTGDEPQVVLKEMPKSDTAILKDNMRDIMARLEYIELVSDIEE